MKRQWYETLPDRQQKMKEKQGKPTNQGRLLSLSEVKKRRPYQWGAKKFLTDFEIGETKLYTERFPWDNLRSTASLLKAQYDVLFLFNTNGSQRYITRIK